MSTYRYKPGPGTTVPKLYILVSLLHFFLRSAIVSQKELYFPPEGINTADKFLYYIVVVVVVIYGGRRHRLRLVAAVVVIEAFCA